MKYLFKFIIIFYFATPLFSQNSVSLAFGTEYFTNQTGYQDVSGLSLNYMRRFNPASEIGLRFNYTTMAYNLSSPSNTAAVNVSVYDLYLTRPQVQYHSLV